MRYLFIIVTIVMLAAHAVVLSPMLEAHRMSAADEIDLALWIFGFGLLLLQFFLLPKRADVDAAELEHPMGVKEAQELSNAQARAFLDNLALAQSPDMMDWHMADALAYGMAAYRVGMDPSTDGIKFVAIPITDLIKNADEQAEEQAYANARAEAEWEEFAADWPNAPEGAPLMMIRMHRGSIDKALETEERIPATMDAVRAYLLRHDWPEALLGQLEVEPYSTTPAHGWFKHFIILLNKIPVGFTSAPVNARPVHEAIATNHRASLWEKLREQINSPEGITFPSAPTIMGVDLAKPGSERTVIMPFKRHTPPAPTPAATPPAKRQSHGGARKRAKEARTAARAPAAWPAMGAAA